MPLSKQEIITAATDFTEGRPVKVNLSVWLDFEIQKIINKKRYWWRKKSFTFNSVAGTATYNLGKAGTGHLDKADDLAQLINLYRVESSGGVSKIYPQNNEDEIQKALAETDTGEPSWYLIEPGTTKTLRLVLTPNAARTYRGLYWAGYNPSPSETGDTIPLIPETHHYVCLEALLRRVFLHLFGHKDARYIAQDAEYREALADLAAIPVSSSEMVTELRTSDESVIVRSTN